MDLGLPALSGLLAATSICFIYLSLAGDAQWVMRQMQDHLRMRGSQVNEDPLLLSSCVTYCFLLLFCFCFFGWGIGGRGRLSTKSLIVTAERSATSAAMCCMPRWGKCPRRRAAVHWGWDKKRGSCDWALGPRESIQGARWTGVPRSALLRLSRQTQ